MILFNQNSPKITSIKKPSIILRNNTKMFSSFSNEEKPDKKLMVGPATQINVKRVSLSTLLPKMDNQSTQVKRETSNPENEIVNSKFKIIKDLNPNLRNNTSCTITPQKFTPHFTSMLMYVSTSGRF